MTRRDAIAQYDVVGASPQSDLQGLVELAATLCGVPTAVINLIDDTMQYQVAATGVEPAVCSIEESMCAVALRTPGPMVVPDASADDRFSANPFVSGALGNVRFYASSPLVTPTGVPIGTVCIFDTRVRDLTDELSRCLDLIAHQVVDVLELRRTTRELESSNEQLERFAGQVSHDLRNPLTAVSGFIELAADSPEVVAAPQVAAALFRADAAATRMGAMIADLLDYARLGGARPRREQVALPDLIGDVLDDLDQALTATDTEVTVDADARISGDPTLLHALFQNLIANAVKFSHAVGVTPRVEVRAYALDGSWRVTVDDNGPGVPAEQRERVFGLMERGAAGDAPGLGIGLSTCRRIVEAHGGSIGIDDSPLGGASVWVILPRSE
ncbi:GAF domain-containing sensor histidine kinase [Agreia sp. COWG]|uniref:GAF domain-containing sensor histidine kinase n=1 Tax=Agreia sp. COWG TaxID=2773266 RepID=UPI0019274CE8|nr:GAF domain-containing sensor histidine kinase [Agreia sp. COWG]CAD6008877.1 Histidine kinase [Agreia sp. COWG]